MSDGTAAPADRAAPAQHDGATDSVDWTRIERSEDFRELTSRRNRFIAAASALTFTAFGVYLALAVFAHGVMGTTILGGVPLAWPLAMSQVFLTWIVTWSYLRKADREFAPLEQRIADRATARFTREEDGDGHAAADGARAEAPTTVAATTERSAR
jgi:uncharacterized membrane protein (DUF485 family)